MLVAALALSGLLHAVVMLAVSIRPLNWTVTRQESAFQAIQLPALQAVEVVQPRPAPPQESVPEPSVPVVALPVAPSPERDAQIVATSTLALVPVEPTRPIAASEVLPVRETAPVEDTAERGHYEQEVARWVERQRIYPLAARQRRLEGTAIVRIQVDGDGALLDARLVRDTGHAVLDRAALDMVHRAAPYPSVPRPLASAPVEVLVPIQFTLSR